MSRLRDDGVSCGRTERERDWMLSIDESSMEWNGFFLVVSYSLRWSPCGFKGGAAWIGVDWLLGSFGL